MRPLEAALKAAAQCTAMALLAAGNFFEPAVAITSFGPGAGAALATVVGAPVEVSVRLSVCAACNRTPSWFAGFEAETAG